MNDLELPELPTERLWTRAILASVLIVLLISSGGILLIRNLTSNTTDASLAPTPTPLRCDAVHNTQQIYQITPQQSRLRYQLDIERLATGTYEAPTGETSAIMGYFVVHDDQILGCGLSVLVSALESDATLLNDALISHFSEDELLFFIPKQAVQLPKTPSDDAPQTLRIDGIIQDQSGNLQQDSTWNIQLEHSPRQLSGSAESVVLLSDLIGDTITIEDELISADDIAITVEFVALLTDDLPSTTPNPADW